MDIAIDADDPYLYMPAATPADKRPQIVPASASYLANAHLFPAARQTS
jgi:hypothetical protein